MRDYSKVSGSFWTGKTGKSLRGNMEAQLVALYLMSSPHANMIGVYNLPIGYIQIDTGLPYEGALKGLQYLCEGGFCTYDEDSESVFVHEMARFQIGDTLKQTDNRVKDIQKQYDSLPESRIKSEFFKRYSKCFYLVDNSILESPFEAPSKPETGTETETETNIARENEGEKQNQKQSSENQLPAGTATGRLAAYLIAQGVTVTPANPILVAWVRDGIQHNEFDAAVLISRQQLGDGKKIPCKYLDAVIRGQRSQQSDAVADGKPAKRPWFISVDGIAKYAFDNRLVSSTSQAEKKKTDPEFRQMVLDHAGISQADIDHALSQWGEK